MESPVRELERILMKEQEIFERLASIEEEKTGTILAKDGIGLEAQAKEQEALLADVTKLETAREESIRKYRDEHHLDEKFASLADVISVMDEDSALKLSLCGVELKKTVLRMQSMSQTNNRLIEDNMEFFNILVAGLKNSVSPAAGYTADGGSPRMRSGSLIFNKTV
jgi:flagellar biosynthesis/type III secretory pathway chaperone